MSFKSRKNVYTCRTCGWRAITIDLADGVTPFLIRCESQACTPPAGSVYRSSMAQSSFYRPPPGLASAEPTHEWYRPDTAELGKLGPSLRQHVEAGGLLLRKRAA